MVISEIKFYFYVLLKGVGWGEWIDIGWHGTYDMTTGKKKGIEKMRGEIEDEGN